MTVWSQLEAATHVWAWLWQALPLVWASETAVIDRHCTKAVVILVLGCVSTGKILIFGVFLVGDDVVSHEYASHRLVGVLLGISSYSAPWQGSAAAEQPAYDTRLGLRLAVRGWLSKGATDAVEFNPYQGVRLHLSGLSQRRPPCHMLMNRRPP